MLPAQYVLMFVEKSARKHVSKVIICLCFTLKLEVLIKWLSPSILITEQYEVDSFSSITNFWFCSCCSFCDRYFCNPTNLDEFLAIKIKNLLVKAKLSWEHSWSSFVFMFASVYTAANWEWLYIIFFQLQHTTHDTPLTTLPYPCTTEIKWNLVLKLVWAGLILKLLASL